MALKLLLSSANEPQVADMLQPAAIIETSSGDNKCEPLDRARMPHPYIITEDITADCLVNSICSRGWGRLIEQGQADRQGQ